MSFRASRRRQGPDERSMRRDRLRAMPCKEEDNKRSAVNLKRTNKKCIKFNKLLFNVDDFIIFETNNKP